MVKIWAKLIKDDKILKSYVFEKNDDIDYSLFFEYLSDITYNLDIPTPVLIKTHIFNYAKYNYVRFTKSDFVESITFDKLVLENIADK
ncbi:MAG: hypothetical protein J6V68_02255 [Clostridia bacterium]|nr:hypothetical protein [Clostridia bacterium]